MLSQPPNTILLIEDEPSLALTYEEYLRRASYGVTVAQNGADAMACLRQFRPDAIVLDLHLPDIDGIELLRQARALYPHVPVVVVTADASPQVALAAMREGATDFILKPFNAPRLTLTLRHTLERQALEQELTEWRQALGHSRYYDFIGQSPPMQAVYRIIESVAASKACVFITGESGTGKELAAQALHQSSPRRAHSIISINCGAIPHDLLESTLFGHVKGAFTGAVNDATGAAKAADGGTLFLDEVCELPLELQVKLLRFLQTSEVTPVGGSKAEKVDVRIVAATNRNPQAEVKAGRLREDLYYRLHVVPLDMPPLRERDDDVLLLAEHFLQKFSDEEGKDFTNIAPEAASLLRRADWPGNVRQLENVVRSIVVMHQGPSLTLAMLPEELQTSARTIADYQPSATAAPQLVALAVKPLWQMEKEAILQALSLTQNDVARAATLLEVSPSTLYRKLHSWRRGEPA